MQFKILSFFLLLTLISCADSENYTAPKQASSKPQFTKISSDQSNIEFINQVIGNDETGIFNYDYFYNGGGVATGDFNNDGLQDIVLSGNSVKNKIYLNKGDFVFEDITETAGIQSNLWTTGITLVDINNDGWEDIYFCNSGPFRTGQQTVNQLYINNKNNTFKESAADYGIDDMGRSTHASFFDFDLDGDLDLFVLNHSLRNRGSFVTQWLENTNKLTNDIKSRESCSLYRNNGNNKFVNISQSAGINGVGFGLGHAIRDFNNDGLLDIYVANDFFVPDFLYMNNGDGTFKESIKDFFKHTSYFSMGTDAADIDNDGNFDLVTLDMTPKDHVRSKTMMASMSVESFKELTENQEYIHQYMFNSLFINNSEGEMKDVGQMLGVSQTGWSWAPLLLDVDNNGYKDLFITNGYKKDILNKDWQNKLNEIQRSLGSKFDSKAYNKHLESATETALANQLYINSGDLDFSKSSKASGLTETSFSNGAAYADFDNDGDLDLIVNNFDKAAFLYENNSRDNSNSNFLRVKLVDDTNKGTEQHAKLCIYYKEEKQCNTYSFARGYQSYMEEISHFGLGEINQVDRLEITWLDGTIQTVSNPAINSTLELKKKGSPSKSSAKQIVQSYFTDVSDTALSPDFKHVENTYNEYTREILLPHSQSNEGPALAVGDLNGDKLDDFFIGGSTGQSSRVYLQNQDGKFIQQKSPDLEREVIFEDTGAAFSDIDQDGDLDLYVTSGGGSEFQNNPEYLQDRIYSNNGKGIFSKVRIPKIASSTKAVVIADLNRDGRDEMVIGGRTQPGKYPTSPRSHILSTTVKGIQDLTAQFCSEISSIGMVTDALATDINADGLVDLILVGEWMPITILINTPEGLVNKTDDYQLSNTSGWWSHINAGDFDNDGDEDYIIGNIGQNNKFQPSPEKPLYLNANDFDGNGSMDIVLNKIYSGKRVPTRGKECSTEQMPFLGEKFDSYEKFANASLVEIYSQDKLDKSIKLAATTFESIYLENDKGTLKIKPLPRVAQVSPINGSAILDVNRDGHLDVIVAGNKFNAETETQRYDAGSGCILLGNGMGDFQAEWKIDNTGLPLDKDVRALETINIGKDNKTGILVANNSDVLQLFMLNNKNR